MRCPGEPIQERDDEPGPVRIPADFKSGQRYMEQTGRWTWDVYDWSPGECGACRGLGFILEKDSGDPQRKCLNCTGTGSDHDEPEQIATGLSEENARLLVFGAALLTAAMAVLDGWYGSKGEVYGEDIRRLEPIVAAALGIPSYYEEWFRNLPPLPGL